MSFAKVVISGTLTGDPEKRFTPNNHAVTSFTLSAENTGSPNRAGANEPFFLRVTCWRNLAEAVTTQLHKGDYVLVEGKLMMNSFQAQDGTQKKVFEVEAASIEKLPGKPEAIVAVGEGAGAGSSGQQGYDATSRVATPSYEASYNNESGAVPGMSSTGSHFSSEDLLTEDDIPF
ncbi:MAG TPA: single-stranded DNA-binding protein [Coleofasciculaceae cyanobacterium]